MIQNQHQFIIFFDFRLFFEPSANDEAGPSNWDNVLDNDSCALRNLINERKKQSRMLQLMENLRNKANPQPKKKPSENKESAESNKKESAENNKPEAAERNEEASVSSNRRREPVRVEVTQIEKVQVLNIMDTIHTHIRVIGRERLVDRLTSLSRKVNLLVHLDRGSLYMSAEMFYIDIHIDVGGNVTNVHVYHGDDGVPCQEMTDSLIKHDYDDFLEQVQNLKSIYDLITNIKAEKANAYRAITALELDLQKMYQMNANAIDADRLFSSVGIVEPRRGGHPMRIHHFVSLYQLMHPVTHRTQTISADLFKGPNAIGMNAIVHIEPTAAGVPYARLPIKSIFEVRRDEHNAQRMHFAPLTDENSALIPATFVLRFSKPFVIDSRALQAIEKITGLNVPVQVNSLVKEKQRLLEMIVAHVHDGQLKLQSKKMESEGLLVYLPDQKHQYVSEDGSDIAYVSGC